MKCWRIATLTTPMLLPVSAFAANPFLDAKDDKPVSAKFRGAEWGDEIQQDEIPLIFTDLKSSAPQKREIQLDYFIVTDDRIILLNEEDNEAALKKISAMDKPPTSEEGDIRGITSGKLNYEDGPWTTTIEIKGDECTYLASHNSGHFTKVVWKKAVGLIEYASGYGAHADGFRLKRQN